MKTTTFNIWLLFLAGALLISVPSPAQTKQEIAKQDIIQLRNSFLLVRLQTKSKTIAALEERGMEKEAEMVRRKQYDENRETINSFIHTFDFCPVYFFYSDDSDEIRNGQLSGNVFDQNLQVEDSTGLLSTRPFYTAEFSQTDNFGISALMIMDQYMVPLEAPFPYFERKYVFFSLIKLSKARMAEKLNQRLHTIYNEWVTDKS